MVGNYVWFLLATGIRTLCAKFHCSRLTAVRYGDGAGNTIEENFSIFSLIRMH